MYKAILFDLDNTLLLPETTVVAELRKLTINEKALFTEEDAREAYRQAELWTARQILHEIETAYRMDDDLFLKNVLSHYYERCSVKGETAQKLIDAVVTNRTRTQPAQNVYTLLSDLKKNYVLGIVSNNSKRVHQILEEYKLKEHFQVITISEEIGIEKPDPRIMAETCKALSVCPSDCLYVGDHPFDILCSSKAGMDCIWIDHGYFKTEDLPEVPKYSIADIQDLRQILLSS